MPPSWNDLLFEKLKQLNSHNLEPARIAILGIGNDLRGDDSAGLVVARRLLTDERLTRASSLLILEGGPAPENQTGKLRAFRPDLVLFIDAAHLQEAPGTVELIPVESIDGMSASSHSLPLSMLARYIISEFGCQVEVIGIEPEQNEISEELSLPVRDAVSEVVCQLGNLLA